jgi:hypothetical protein
MKKQTIALANKRIIASAFHGFSGTTPQIIARDQSRRFKSGGRDTRQRSNQKKLRSPSAPHIHNSSGLI